VEVEDVEALAVEQLAHLADVPRRERQGADGAVERTLKPTPMRRMSPSDARWGPWLAVMMRTS
jgi:hypothetical protein